MNPVAEGRLHSYSSGRNLTLFEYSAVPADVTENSPAKLNTLIFIGGLSDSFLSVPYVSLLASYVGQCPDWTLMEIQLSSSGPAWGTADLHSDALEISQAVTYVRDRVRESYLKASVVGKSSRVVLMGHSTGSQDVLHYLAYASGQQKSSVDGAILQAAVSDREGLAMLREGDEDMQEAYEECLRIAMASRSEANGATVHVLPPDLTTRLGWPRVTVSCGRFLSLTSPSSPDMPELDDLFSSDLSDANLKRTFGKVQKSGVLEQSGFLQPSLLILLSAKDEYTPKTVDKEKLIGRWGSALASGGSVLAASSGVIAGASHNVKEQDSGLDLVKRVLHYLQTVVGAIPEATLIKLEEDIRRQQDKT